MKLYIAYTNVDRSQYFVLSIVNHQFFIIDKLLNYFNEVSSNTVDIARYLNQYLNRFDYPGFVCMVIWNGNEFSLEIHRDNFHGQLIGSLNKAVIKEGISLNSLTQTILCEISGYSEDEIEKLETSKIQIDEKIRSHDTIMREVEILIKKAS